MDEVVRELARKRASLCSIFGNTRRVLIAWTLGEDEMSVGEIARKLGISLQNTSQHLRLMKDKGILNARRDGKTIFYRKAENELADICPIMVQPQNSDLPKRSPEMTDLTTLEVAKVVDARAMACPGPLLEAKKSIGGVKVNEVLEIWAGDPNTKNDMPRWCQKVGHEYLGEMVADGYERLFVRRKK